MTLPPQGPLTIHGLNVPIAEGEVSPIIWQALRSGEYEAKEARLARTLLRAGDRVLELGSGLGIITTVLAQTPDVRIWSFDANPDTVAMARRVAEANDATNVTFAHGLLSAGDPTTHVFYMRRDFWMSSMIAAQGPYEATIEVQSANIDAALAERGINVLVMDVEGAEREILGAATLDGVDRVFLELHDHLYGLTGVREIFAAMDRKGFAYDPRASSGPCVLFLRDDGSIRPYAG
ncbi:FkbM family methyltransferase [Falsirhodobacter sp. 20TX0035]|uniref:FkbM family methyltransferase n=1 Tax=Falsirhodobacter sp. 20TX0035 TaxID=3022019 RepID=UPI00232FA0E2|nr:FkbM family methyltransferase [Falsirhodobacter sp. 20TX0035]MDB6455217.1 FkbM family methyltransferase [Falsirhodobacter sp. 20TX0035]